MLVSFLGDSITQGAGASSDQNCYVSQTGNMLACDVANCGIGGTRIAKRKQLYNHIYDLNFGTRVEFIPQQSDYVIVFGGTNDYGHGDAELGEYASKDEYTFNGALRCLIEKLINKFGKKKLGFILPYHIFNEQQPAKFIKTPIYLSDIVNAQRKMLQDYGIPYLDLYSEWVNAPNTNENSEYFVDGLHPNDKGHYEIAEKVSEFIKNQLIKK